MLPPVVAMEEEEVEEEGQGFDEHPNYHPMPYSTISAETKNSLNFPPSTAFSIPNDGGFSEPHEGMEFECEDDAKKFYNAYACKTGFSVRIGSTSRSVNVNDRRVIGRYFVCSKEGFRQKKKKSSSTMNAGGEGGVAESRHDDDDDYKFLKRKRQITREGCKAKMAVRLNNSTGKWIVRIFVKEHNHALMTPSTVQFLRSHKKLSSSPSMKNSSISEVPGVNDNSRSSSSCDFSIEGVRANLMMSFMRLENSNAARINVNAIEEKDFKSMIRQRGLEKGEAQTVLDYFKRLQAKDPTFFYAIQVDDEERITNFFWVDGRSRIAYDHFGDVVTFDTTYRTNKYKMPFAPFVGLNHHRQTTLFGCALLLDESEFSFVWLFNAWLEAMCGRHPASLITNQDPNIDAAVARVFPKTRHRLCMWHILRKVPEKLSHIYHAHKSFKDEFYRTIHNTETIEEFEECWRFLVDKYDLREHDWIQSLYSIRYRWVPVYFRDSFFADMNTTQRIILFFHGFLNSNTSLQDFVVQYMKAVEGRREKEMHADYETNYMQPILTTQCPMEEEASQLYTRSVFAKFREELVESLAYIVEEEINTHHVGANITSFAVTRYDQEKKRDIIVKLDVSESTAVCSCHMFEFSGLLCRHILIVLRMKNILIIPRKYILRRFTRNATSTISMFGSGNEIQCVNDDSPPSQHFVLLCQRAIKIVKDGMVSRDSYRLALHALEKVSEDIAGAENKSCSSEIPAESFSQITRVANMEAKSTVQPQPVAQNHHSRKVLLKNYSPVVAGSSGFGGLLSTTVNSGLNGCCGTSPAVGESPRLTIGIP